MSSGPPIWFLLAFGAIFLAAISIGVAVIQGAPRRKNRRSSNGQSDDAVNLNQQQVTGAISGADVDFTTPSDTGGHHSSFGSHEGGHSGGSFDGGGSSGSGHH